MWENLLTSSSFWSCFEVISNDGLTIMVLNIGAVWSQATPDEAIYTKDTSANRN